MKFSYSFVCAAAAFFPLVSAGSTSFVKYSSIGYSGHYNDITNMDESTGTCTSSSKSFSGNLSPLDEELSVHIRGPIQLKKFAVYTTSSSSKKKREESPVGRRHQHQKREADVKTVDVTETVYVTEGDDDTSTVAPASTTSATVAVASIGAVNKVLDAYHSTDVNPSSVASSATASSSSSASTGTTSGSWTRKSYYDASAGTASNVVFMNHLGDSSYSGTWSSSFGNSISYADASGTGKSKTATTLKDTTLASDDEVVLFTGEKCGSDCGYYRSDIPAYKGWDGSTKIFAFNFQMPTDSGTKTTNNYDMPAVWLLNAKIPRTLQYGTESCSCWSTGCGELDLWEVITSGSSQMTNHLHDGQGEDGTRWGGGGSSDYFTRPTSSAETFVAVFDGSNVYLKQVSNFDFDSSIDADTVNGWITGTASDAILV
ncbi:Tos1 protein [Saccharomycopsis crataegensis]|uniref:glucan endo-1,3-beta-D-glucosidase n=1 Tax=Saccharomycopsis crataegensis TaxID=43959 RepID=A0AAV5QW87_9ASCO|nr:Tos1 protein [Saccharomycopsis crataegensis]